MKRRAGGTGDERSGRIRADSGEDLSLRRGIPRVEGESRTRTFRSRMRDTGFRTNNLVELLRVGSVGFLVASRVGQGLLL